MSLLLRTANEKDVASTTQRQAVIRSRFNSVVQWSKGVTASTKNINPGTTTKIDVLYNSPNFEQEIGHYIVCDIANAHATATLTLKNGTINLFDEITFSPNGSNYKIEIKNLSQIREITSEYYLNMGLNIYEDSSFIRNEFNTFSGISIPPASSVTVYYHLDPIISWAGTCIKDEIRSMQIDMQCTPEQANAGKTGKYFASSADTNLWTAANITLKNITYVRNFAMLRNPAALLVKLFASVPKGVPIRQVHWRVEERVLYTGSWLLSAGDSFSTKLSDMYKTGKIQHISPFVRPVVTAYNSAECCKEYSGHKFIGWKVRELNTGGDEKELDMTDARKLREFELKQYRNEYGRKQLPLEIFNDGTNLMSKYFLRMSRINFDYLQVENTHEVVRYTNSNLSDYDVTFNALGNAGSMCELCVSVVIAEELDFDRNTGTLYPSPQ
jgi:hypothetical protein